MRETELTDDERLNHLLRWTEIAYKPTWINASIGLRILIAFALYEHGVPWMFWIWVVYIVMKISSLLCAAHTYGKVRDEIYDILEIE